MLNTCPGAERESREHEESLAAENTGELQLAKVPLHPIDIVNSKKVIAVRKEQKRKQGRQRSYSATVDYSPLTMDKHEPEFVSEAFQAERCFHQFNLQVTGGISGYTEFLSEVVGFFFEGSLQEETGRDHSGDEGHVSCHGSVALPSKL